MEANLRSFQKIQRLRAMCSVAERIPAIIIQSVRGAISLARQNSREVIFNRPWCLLEMASRANHGIVMAGELGDS